ncbi:MAG: hypothetical protein VB017_03310 [Endomicrobiaceae bacterium]|jgi:cell division protein FtsX|nr:hypothetical protein [Endomicrobiaceae bacterium]
MKKITINVSRILKVLTLTALMALSSFIAQYYLNFKSDNSKMAEDLKIAVFVDGTVDEKSAVSEINKFFYFNVVDYVDESRSFDKAVELNPELKNVVPENTISYPCYILVNNVSAENMQQLEEIKDHLSSLSFVKDVVYDAKAFEMFYKRTDLLSVYEKIYYVISLFIMTVFLIKLSLAVIKKEFKEIISETAYGCLSALAGYVIICIFAAITHNTVFVLYWHILFVIVPFGAIISFMMKESNVKN